MPIKLPFRPQRDAYPPDLWTKCPSCQEMLFNKQLDKALRVCPTCGHHFRLGARVRLELLLDDGSFTERDASLQSVDPLGFVDQKPYPDRLAAAQLTTTLRDAAVWGVGRIEGRPVAIVVMDFAFMGGSMGAVVGEKVTRAAEAARDERLPLIVVAASGGARMQEGTYALMQLAKTVGALERLRAAGLPFLSVLTDPTTGGVWASFAALGDVNLAEPDALIGFAGARVQAGTISQELPPGFQRAEFLFAHGFVDRVVPRTEMRAELSRLLGYLAPAAVEAVDAIAPGAGLRPLSGVLASIGERTLPEPAPSSGKSGLNGRAPRGSGRPPGTNGRLPGGHPARTVEPSAAVSGAAPSTMPAGSASAMAPASGPASTVPAAPTPSAATPAATPAGAPAGPRDAALASGRKPSRG